MRIWRLFDALTAATITLALTDPDGRLLHILTAAGFAVAAISTRRASRRPSKCQRCAGSGRVGYVEGPHPVLDRSGAAVAHTSVTGTVTCLGCKGTGRA